VKKFSSREIKRLMKKMGLSMEQVEGVDKVILVKSDGTEIHIKNPTVLKMVMGETVTYQIMGTEEVVEEERKVEEIDEEAVKLVMEQTGVDRETAINVLVMTGWDIAKAILTIKGEV